jgi:hypothetical protein
MDVISIVPNDAGWQVESETLPGPLMFFSGGKAEDAAKRLARALAEQDRWVEIRVHMKDGGMLGRFVCPPANLAMSERAAIVTFEPPPRVEVQGARDQAEA